MTGSLDLCMPKRFNYMGHLILFQILKDRHRASVYIRVYWNAILWLRWEFDSNCLWPIKIVQVGNRFPQVLAPLSCWKFCLPGFLYRFLFCLRGSATISDLLVSMFVPQQINTVTISYQLHFAAKSKRMCQISIICTAKLALAYCI